LRGDSEEGGKPETVTVRGELENLLPRLLLGLLLGCESGGELLPLKLDKRVVLIAVTMVLDEPSVGFLSTSDCCEPTRTLRDESGGGRKVSELERRGKVEETNWIATMM
jgi:hypothetical protein